jgi:spermidine synthase
VTPWTLVDQSQTPDGTRLELFQRGKDFSIRANGQLLMNSRVHGSEEELARLGIAPVRERAKARVLVGGLGFGYTLAAALNVLEHDAVVTVAELAAAVVRWNEGPLGALAGAPLADPRVVVHTGDVVPLVRAKESAFDAVLLDVDNGPRALTQASNSWLYTPEGLRALHRALTPNGTLAVWSAGPELGFSNRMETAGFSVTMHRVLTRPNAVRQRHLIWLGTRRGS